MLFVPDGRVGYSPSPRVFASILTLPQIYVEAVTPHRHGRISESRASVENVFRVSEAVLVINVETVPVVTWIVGTQTLQLGLEYF